MSNVHQQLASAALSSTKSISQRPDQLLQRLLRRSAKPERRQRRACVHSTAAQQSAGAAFILDGQGRKVPFPAVGWQTNSKAYAAFMKGNKSAAAPFRLTMGLEALCKHDWIEVYSDTSCLLFDT